MSAFNNNITHMILYLRGGIKIYVYHRTLLFMATVYNSNVVMDI